MKQHKMIMEFISKKETPSGGIDISTSIGLMQDIGKVANKYGFDAYAKGYAKEVLDYQPTGETIVIKTVEDIADLSQDQFEMFIEDLRNWCNLHRNLNVLSTTLGVEIQNESGMIWIDSGENKSNVEATIKFSNQV